jgi:hypothetical protein
VRDGLTSEIEQMTNRAPDVQCFKGTGGFTCHVYVTATDADGPATRVAYAVKFRPASEPPLWRAQATTSVQGLPAVIAFDAVPNFVPKFSSSERLSQSVGRLNTNAGWLRPPWAAGCTGVARIYEEERVLVDGSASAVWRKCACASSPGRPASRRKSARGPSLINADTSSRFRSLGPTTR